MNNIQSPRAPAVHCGTTSMGSRRVCRHEGCCCCQRRETYQKPKTLRTYCQNNVINASSWVETSFCELSTAITPCNLSSTWSLQIHQRWSIGHPWSLSQSQHLCPYTTPHNLHQLVCCWGLLCNDLLRARPIAYAPSKLSWAAKRFLGIVCHCCRHKLSLASRAYVLVQLCFHTVLLYNYINFAFCSQLHRLLHWAPISCITFRFLW